MCHRKKNPERIKMNMFDGCWLLQRLLPLTDDVVFMLMRETEIVNRRVHEYGF